MRHTRLKVHAVKSIGLPVIALISLLAWTGCSDPTGQTQKLKGIERLQAGRDRSASNLLKESIDRQPLSASAHYHLGVALSRLGDFEPAEAAFRKAADLHPDDTSALEYLAYVLMEQKRLPEAQRVLEQARELDPQSPRIKTSLALVTFRMGAIQAYWAQLRQIVKQHPDYPPALYNTAQFYQERLKQPDKAREYFGRYLELSADDPHAETARRGLLQQVEKPAPAQPAPKPTPPPVPVRTAQPKPATPPAIPPPVITRVPVEPTPSAKPQDDDFDAIFKNARSAIDRKDYDTALVLFHQAVQANAFSADALWELATLYDRHLRYPESARRTYDKFRRQFPNDPRARNLPSDPSTTPPAQSTAPSPRTVKATRDWNQLPSIRRLDADEAFNQGVLLQEQKQWDQALAAYQRVLELKPDYANAEFNRGLILKQTGHTAKSIESFQSTLKIKPDFFKARYMLGLIFREEKDYPKAVEELNQAIRLKPDYAEAHFALGLTYRDSKRYDVSRMHFERYLQLAPDGPSSATARKWLETYSR